MKTQTFQKFSLIEFSSLGLIEIFFLSSTFNITVTDFPDQKYFTAICCREKEQF